MSTFKVGMLSLESKDCYIKVLKGIKSEITQLIREKKYFREREKLLNGSLDWDSKAGSFLPDHCFNQLSYPGREQILSLLIFKIAAYIILHNMPIQSDNIYINRLLSSNLNGYFNHYKLCKYIPLH